MNAVAIKLIVLRCRWCGWKFGEASEIPTVLQLPCPNHKCRMVTSFGTGEKL